MLIADIENYGGTELNTGDKVEVRGVQKEEFQCIQKPSGWEEKMTEVHWSYFNFNIPTFSKFIITFPV